MIAGTSHGLEKGFFPSLEKPPVMKPRLGQHFIACSHTNFYYRFCHLKNWVESLLSIFSLTQKYFIVESL